MSVVSATSSSASGGPGGHGESARSGPPPLSVGVVVWLASELMFFAGLFAAYYVLRSINQPDGWPPADVEIDVLRGVLATIVLLASSATMHASVRAAERDDRRGALRWMYATFLLGTAFVVNLGFEWAANDFSISTHAYGSIYYLLTGFHGLHLVGGLALMATAAIVVSGTDAKAPLGPTFTVSAYYWHFVDLVWVFVFTTIWIVQ